MIENTFGMNIIPANDTDRLNALKRYRILDTPSEDSFDNIARLATQIFSVPISLISLVDAEKVFFKANVGMGTASEANRGKSLCALSVLNAEPTIFEDALKEPCLMANPNVAGEFGLRFYAGAPLITHDGFLIGTLCIIDKKTRSFSKQEEEILKGLATAVMDQIELRLAAFKEIEKERELNEELQTINEEMNAANDGFAQSQFDLSIVNEELAKSADRFKKLIEHSPVAIATLKGRDLIVDCVNEMILKIWGKDHSVVGLPLSVALPEIAGQPFLGILDQVYTTGEPYFGYEAKVQIEQDGELRDVFVNFVYQPIDVPGDSGRDIMVVANDITLQVQGRKELDELNMAVKIAVDAGNLGTTEVTLATGKMSSSDQFKAHYGYKSDEEFTYPDLFEAMLPQYRIPVKEMVAKAIRENGVYKAEYQVKWKSDGTIHWLSAHGRPRYDEQGNVISMVGMNRDITEIKLYEQRKDDFLSIASHELKTPVTSLKASLQLLDRMKDKPMSPSHVRLIEQANRSLDKMSKLIDDLLNINRLTTGHLVLEKHDFSIAHMLETCCNHVRVEGEYELILEGDLDLNIHADEHRIDQVVVNFVNNAVKYAPESKQIFLKVSREANHARISVTDKGAGISNDKLEFLFDRYYRAESESKSYSGLGLGLYICAEIIKKHGGEIGVYSKPGEGSTFWFTLPI